MQTKDIEIGGKYLAKITYSAQGPVEVLETGVERGHRPSTKKRDGVRVKLLRPARVGYGVGIKPAGTETVLSSREIVRAWTPEDDERAEAREAALKEQERLAALLDERGIEYRHWGDGFGFKPEAVRKLLGEEVSA